MVRIEVDYFDKPTQPKENHFSQNTPPTQKKNPILQAVGLVLVAFFRSLDMAISPHEPSHSKKEGHDNIRLKRGPLVF